MFLRKSWKGGVALVPMVRHPERILRGVSSVYSLFDIMQKVAKIKLKNNKSEIIWILNIAK
jgi:hypothetical protein